MRNLLLLIIASIAFAGEAPVNPVIKSSLDTYETEVAKAYAEYLKTIAKVNEKTAKDMDTKLKAAMKKGDLETATAIKTAMDEVAKGKVRTNLEDKWRAEADQNPADLLTAPPAAGEIKVLSATFETTGEIFDITEKVQAKLSVVKKPFTLDAKVFGDPIPGTSKVLTIVYVLNGKKSSKTFNSWDVIDISKF